MQNEFVKVGNKVRLSGLNCTDKWFVFSHSGIAENSVTMQSPIGKEIFNKKVGDEVLVVLPKEIKMVRIEEIQLPQI